MPLSGARAIYFLEDDLDEGDRRFRLLLLDRLLGYGLRTRRNAQSPSVG